MFSQVQAMNSDEGCWWYLNISDDAAQGPLAGNFSGTSRVASWKTWFWQLEPLHRIRSWLSSTNYNKQRRKGLWPCRALPEALTNTIIYYSNVHQSDPYILSCQWHIVTLAIFKFPWSWHSHHPNNTQLSCKQPFKPSIRIEIQFKNPA